MSCIIYSTIRDNISEIVAENHRLLWSLLIYLCLHSRPNLQIHRSTIRMMTREPWWTSLLDSFRIKTLIRCQTRYPKNLWSISHNRKFIKEMQEILCNSPKIWHTLFKLERTIVKLKLQNLRRIQYGGKVNKKDANSGRFQIFICMSLLPDL